MAEFPSLGRHCSFSVCNQLDFLPFTCKFCEEIFCIDHQSPVSHECRLAVQVAENAEICETSNNNVNSLSSTLLYSCSVQSCKNKETVYIKCDFCDLQICISHRFPESHDCSKCFVKRTAEKSPIKIQISNEHCNPPVKKAVGRKSKKTSALLNLMVLKKDAVGQSSLPLTERCYFSLALLGSSEHKSKSTKIFFSNKWSIGRCIDFAAAQLKISNSNNVPGTKKLVFYTEDKHLLDSSKVVQDLLTTGVIENGQALIMDYLAS